MRSVGGDDGEALDVEDEDQLDEVDHGEAGRHEHSHPDHPLVVHYSSNRPTESHPVSRFSKLYYILKGIDRSFELRGEIRVNRFVRTNWRLGIFFYFILKGHHHKISKKPMDAA